MKVLFATFLVFLFLATVLSHSIDDIPETHISDDFVGSVIRRSSPKNRRVIRRYKMKLRRLNRLLTALKKKIRRTQGKFAKRVRKAKEANKRLTTWQKCAQLRRSRGKGRRICGRRFTIEKEAKMANKKRARARAALKFLQKSILKVQKKIWKIRRKLNRMVGGIIPRPSVSPLAIA